MFNSNQGPWNRTAVRCLASSRAHESPLSFLTDEGEVEIHAVHETWREPDWLCFRIETKDGLEFDLRHHEFDDFWEMRARPVPS
jgi:hypothetical protein